MPLRCLDPATGTSIHAFDLSHDEWWELSLVNRKRRHLRMACCSSEVVLRKSRHGTQHFVHKAARNCTTSPESEAHFRLKRLVVAAARANGWNAETEVVGQSVSGETWQADVLASKGSTRVAVEIQWSRQTKEETWRRQRRYAESEIRCLWLLRQNDIPIDPDLPAARIAGNLKDGFSALIPGERAVQLLPMYEFLNAAFGGHFRFGIPLDAHAAVTVRTGHIFCWSCGCETHIVIAIDVVVGPNEYKFTVPDIGAYPDLFETVRNRVPAGHGFEAIRRRFSKTQNRTYLSNGCIHCDAIVGEFFEHEAVEDSEKACSYVFRICDRWRTAIRNYPGYADSWGVFPIPEG